MSSDPAFVSVLMPTFKQAGFIRRAIESLRAQTHANWELVVVDDGSPDNTGQILRSYSDDTRIRYHRIERNVGLGAALNTATELARAQLISYLPSDDVYHPHHLEWLVQTLNGDPSVYLAYGGVQIGYSSILGDTGWAFVGPTLRGDEAVGREAEALAETPPAHWTAPLRNGNILALVQVMHRRDLETAVTWKQRSEVVTDALEPDFWRQLLARGAQFRYSGKISCEWVQHPEQHHRIVGGRLDAFARLHGGPHLYRAHYCVDPAQYLNWQPVYGPRLDEALRFGALAASDAPRWRDRRPLKILIVGELGMNPDRLVALRNTGHVLGGLWLGDCEVWDAVGPFPWLQTTNIAHDRSWRDRVSDFAPDIIYALLNWQAVRLIREVVDAQLGIPVVFHFKEGPGYCYQFGLWQDLVHILVRSDAQIFINNESREWFRLATDGAVGSGNVMVLDGDLPKVDWFTNEYAPKLSAGDGEPHTVCTGRWLGPDLSDLADLGIHVHLYGERFHEHTWWAEQARIGRHIHLHPYVYPSDWVRELSQYDAGWMHVFNSQNAGDLRRASWDDLNFPARLGTYAAAGLPWIVPSSTKSASVTAIENLANRSGVGIPYTGAAELRTALQSRDTMARLTQRARSKRDLFAFDTHVEALCGFFHAVIERKARTSQRARPLID